MPDALIVNLLVLRVFYIYKKELTGVISKTGIIVVDAVLFFLLYSICLFPISPPYFP